MDVITMHLVFSICVEVKMIYEYLYFCIFRPSNSNLEQHSYEFTINVFLTLKMLYTKIETIDFAIFQENVKNVKLLTHDAQRKTSDDGRILTAIGQLHNMEHPTSLRSTSQRMGLNILFSKHIFYTICENFHGC